MLINSIALLNKAKIKGYAIPQFNINNMEWAKYILEASNECQTDIILGVSESAIKYMGGVNTVVGIIKGLIKDLHITINVVLHLDHGKSFNICKECIDAGFTSVMIDASHMELDKNISLTNEVCNYAHQFNISVEGELGAINTNIHSLNITNYEDITTYLKETSVDALAPALGSVHGLYKEIPNLDFDTMERVKNNFFTPLVLHGGTGISNKDIKKAIKSGITKINFNTELQIAWSTDVKKYINNNPNIYDPRTIISAGEKAIKEVVIQKIKLLKGEYE